MESMMIDAIHKNIDTIQIISRWRLNRLKPLKEGVWIVSWDPRWRVIRIKEHWYISIRPITLRSGV